MGCTKCWHTHYAAKKKQQKEQEGGGTLCVWSLGAKESTAVSLKGCDQPGHGGSGWTVRGKTPQPTGQVTPATCFRRDRELRWFSHFSRGKKKIKRLFHDTINDMLLWHQCPHIKFSWNTAKPVHLWTVCSGFCHRDLISPWSLKYLFSGPWQSVPAPDLDSKACLLVPYCVLSEKMDRKGLLMELFSRTFHIPFISAHVGGQVPLFIPSWTSLPKF